MNKIKIFINNLDNIDNIKNKEDLISELNYSFLNEKEKKETIDKFEYVRNLKDLFIYIKTEYIDKNKEFKLSDFENYTNNVLETVFQPIVDSNENKIQKYEALIRYKNNNNTKLKFSNTIKFLTEYCNSQSVNIENDLLTREILKLGISKEVLNTIKSRLSNDLFHKNLIESEKYLEDLKTYALKNTKKNITQSNIDNLKITINTGPSQLFSKEMLLKEGETINNKEYKARLEFIKKYIEFEFLEYPIVELDEHCFNDEYKSINKNNLKNNLELLNSIGTKINLDDYIDTKHLLNRIGVLDEIFKEKFSSIKIDGEIVKKVNIYKILQDENDDKKLMEKLLKEKNILNEYFSKEVIDNINLKNFQDRIKPILIENANKGIFDTIKINYMNTYHFDNHKTENLDKKSFLFLNNEKLISIDKIKKFFDDFNNNQFKRKKKEDIKIIIYEYIENNKVKDMLLEIKKLFPGSKNKINFQGFYFSKPLTTTEIINSNNSIDNNFNKNHSDKNYMKSKEFEKS